MTNIDRETKQLYSKCGMIYLMSSEKNDFLHGSIFIVIFLIYLFFSRNEIIGFDFQLILFFILILYLVIIRRLCIIKDSFLLKNYEIKPAIVVTIFFVAVFIIISLLKGGNIALLTIFSYETLFQTFTEELVFRVFLLGVFIKKIPLIKDKTLPIYIPENDTKNLCIWVVVVSVFFAILHMDSNLFGHFIRSLLYSSAFVLANKKIYAPWFMHYINNLYGL